MGSAVPSRISLLILHTQAESGAYSRDSSRFPRRRLYINLNRHAPLGQSRAFQVTQLRTDGVHCRESAGTGPVVLKIVPVTGAAFLQINVDQLTCASLSPHPILVRSGYVVRRQADSDREFNLWRFEVFSKLAVVLNLQDSCTSN